MWRVVILAFCAFVVSNVPVAGQFGRPVPSRNAPAEQPAGPEFDQNTTVLLKVSLIEIPVTKLRQEGVDFNKLLEEGNPDNATAKQKPAGDEIELFGEWKPGSSGCFLLKEDDPFLSKVKKLVKDKMAKIVAQPILVTSNGRAANFNCGGEFPVPVPQSAAAITTEWKKHGLNVNYAPLVLDQESIRLELHVTLSELDEGQSIHVGATTVPGLRILADMDTAFKIKTGQVAVVSGGTRSFAVHDPAASDTKKKEAKTDANADSSSETLEEKAMLILIKPEIVPSE
jgi:Flp pilus assembly secretin CpaC